MGHATWTYEVPSLGASAVGLEDYMVERSDGEKIGSVLVVVERDRERYVVAETGRPPVRRDRRAIPCRLVERVDHDRLAVRLRAGAEDEAEELDPERAMNDASADAPRVLALETIPSASADPGRPVDDTRRYMGALGLGLAAIVSLLAVIAATTTASFTGLYALYAIPAVLGALAVVAVYRLVRKPYV